MAIPGGSNGTYYGNATSVANMTLAQSLTYFRADVSLGGLPLNPAYNGLAARIADGRITGPIDYLDAQAIRAANGLGQGY